jgi:hypothetical protein
MVNSVLVLLLCIFTCIHAQVSGGRLIISSQGLNDAIKKYTPDFEAVIMATQIPDIHATEHVSLIGDVDVTISNVKVTKVRVLLK